MDSIIYTRIKELCAERGITPGRLEADLGMSNTSISKWRGGTSPKIDTIAKVAAYFHVSIDYLVGASSIRATADELTRDPDYISLQRARERMTDRDRNRMMSILRIGFDYAFSDEEMGSHGETKPEDS